MFLNTAVRADIGSGKTEEMIFSVFDVPVLTFILCLQYLLALKQLKI